MTAAICVSVFCMPSSSFLTACGGVVGGVLVRTRHADDARPATQHERRRPDQRRREQRRLAAAAANAGGGNAVIDGAQVEAALRGLHAGVRVHARGLRSRCGRGCCRSRCCDRARALAGHRRASGLRESGGSGACRCRSAGSTGPGPPGAAPSGRFSPRRALRIADVLGRGNARFPILIHESPPAWLRHARYVCFESGVCGRKVKARTVTNEARTILMPSKPVKRTPPNHSVFIARGGLPHMRSSSATSSRGN